MVLDPKKTFYDDMRIIQRDVQGDLPALNASGSPELGTVCRLNNGQFWMVVADDLDPNNLLIWEQIGGGAELLPDQRFTVARAEYNLNPPSATLTTISNGIAAALAGTDTTLGAASSSSQRLVWVMPDQYTENLTLRPYVHVEGAGPSQAARIIGGLTYASGSGYVVVKNVHITGGTISITPTNGAKLIIIFDDCTFEGVTWSLTTPGGDALTQVIAIFNGCTGQIVNATSTIGAGDIETHYIYGIPSTGTGDFGANRGITFANTPTWTGSGSATVVIGGGQRLTANGAGGPMLRFTGTILGSVVTEDCLLTTGNLQASVFGSTSNNGTAAEWVCRSGTKLAITPRSYWSTSTTAKFTGGQLEILAPTINDASAPLDPVSGGAVTAELYPSNRERNVQAFNFSVPSSQAGGGGPYADAAAAISAMTINAAVATNAYADEYRIVCIYPNLNTDSTDPASANFASTFRFASFQLKNPSFLEDGRFIVVKNDTDPSAVGAGPFALRLPNGVAGNVEHKISDASINGTFDLTNYVILQPGQSAILSIDRQTAYAPAYTVISVVDTLPGVPSNPDQRFTVGKAAYALNGPGTNTFLTPEDGIAAAQAGTGTALGAASATSPRVVWIEPDTYQGPQGPVSLLPNVHLLGAAGYDSAVILDTYALDFASAGRLSMRGIQFKNCSIVAHPTGDSQIEFTECEFIDCTWASTNDDVPVTNYRFVRCHGTFISHVDTLSANAQIYKQFDGGDSSGGYGNGRGPLLAFVAAPEVTGAGGLITLSVSGGQQLTPPNNSHALLVSGDANASIVTRDCRIETYITASLWKGTTTGFVEWQSGPSTTLSSLPFSYFDVVAQAIFVGNEVCITGSTGFPTGGAPLDPVSGGTVDASQTFASNRQRQTQQFDFNVPVAGSTVAAQTVNNAVATNAYADEYRIKTTYPGGFVLQPNSAIPLTFQYASFVLTDPSLLEEGREIVIKNTSDPTANGSSVALRLPNGSTSRIDYKQADISVNTTFSSVDFVILAAGDSVRMSVDRTVPGTARYWVTG